MRYSPPSLLPALCTHCFWREGLLPCFPWMLSSSSSSLQCTPRQGQGTHQHSLNPSAQTPGEDPWSAGPSNALYLKLRIQPHTAMSPPIFHAFSSLLVFILPVLVVGTSCRRNCKCSPFLVCESGSLPWCHRDIWDIPGTDTGCCTAVHFLGVANSQKNPYWFLFWRNAHDKSEINTELHWCFSVAALSNELIADTQDLDTFQFSPTTRNFLSGLKERIWC